MIDPELGLGLGARPRDNDNNPVHHNVIVPKYVLRAVLHGVLYPEAHVNRIEKKKYSESSTDINGKPSGGPQTSQRIDHRIISFAYHPPLLLKSSLEQGAISLLREQ